VFLQSRDGNDQEAGRESGLVSTFRFAVRVGVVGLALVGLTSASLGNAQSFLREFHDHNAEVKQVQPTWVTPLVGTTPLLGQFCAGRICPAEDAGRRFGLEYREQQGAELDSVAES
jgi:hypothetical protein